MRHGVEGFGERCTNGRAAGSSKIDDARSVKDQVRELLMKEMAVSSIFFSLMDANGNGQIDRREFRKAIAGMRGDVPDSVCNELFEEFDADRSGDISYAEYNSFILRETLRKNCGHAMEFVKRWDVDGSGEIEKWEFRRAIAAMGVVVADIAMVDHLFDVMDTDRSGTLSLEEISQQLRRGVTGESPRRKGFPRALARNPEQCSPSGRIGPRGIWLPQDSSTSPSRVRVAVSLAELPQSTVSRSLPLVRPPRAQDAPQRSPPSIRARAPRRDVQSLPLLRPPAQSPAKRMPAAPRW